MLGTDEDVTVRSDVRKSIEDMTDAIVVHRSRCFPTIHSVVRIIYRILEHDVGDTLCDGRLRWPSALA